MKKIKWVSVFSLLIILCLILAWWLFGEFFGNHQRMRINLAFHKEMYAEVAGKFLNQNNIKNIQVSVGLSKTTESVNNCGRYPYEDNTAWTCTEGGYPDYESITLPDIDAVLDYLKIPKVEYQYYTQFMRKYNFDGLGKDDEKRFVEIVDKLEGLRYYEQENITNFITDNNYLSVDKIDDHWYFFSTDWN